MAICIFGSAVILTGLFFISRSSSVSLPTQTEEMEISPEIDRINPYPQRLDTPLPAQPQYSEGSGQQSLSPDLAAQMDAIQQQVIALRGLQPNKPVIRALLSPADLQKKVETDFFKDYSAQDAIDDVMILSTLGLLPKNFDLLDLYKKIYSEQIAGYYNSETKDMFVVKGKTFGGIERMTYAHEFTHILQDQNYDLQNGLKINDENCKIETEYCSAVTALLEGDAIFTEQEWTLSSATQEDRVDIRDFYSSYSSPVFDSAPQYMQEDILFPYKKGLEFVYSLKDRSGYALVDKAMKEPPISTEQILHPDKYPSEKPVEVDLPDLMKVLPGEWKQVEKNVLGEWYSYLVLAKGQNSRYQLPENTARNAAAGWGGDRYGLFVRQSDNAVLFLLVSRWDSEKDASEFFSALKLYGQERWGPPAKSETGATIWNQKEDGDIIIDQQRSDTLWLITPDETTRNKILAGMPAFQVH